MAIQSTTDALLEERRSLPPTPMTYEEFLEWLDEDTWAEWLDGEVVILSPAGLPHQDLKGFLYSLMRFFSEHYDSGVVLDAPFQMKLSKVQRGREPDILFILKGNLSCLKETYLDGPADLVIEIISPESVLRDRGEKFAEYEIAGVPEYWLFDPYEKHAAFFVLGPDGRYTRQMPDGNGIYHSAVLPGFWLKVDWLWQEPLPHLFDILKEWGLIR